MNNVKGIPDPRIAPAVNRTLMDGVTVLGDGGHAKVVRTCSAVMKAGTIVAVGDNRDRKKEAERLPEGSFGILAHLSAVISGPGTTFGEGTVIMAQAVVQPGCKIGRHVIINTGATVDHDCELADYVHIAPGAHLCGGVRVGEGALVGVGVAVAPGAIVPPWSLAKTRRLEITPL